MSKKNDKLRSECENGQLQDVVKALPRLKKQTAIEELDPETGMSAFHLAAASKKDSVEKVTCFIDNKGDFNAEDTHGRSPIVHAIRAGNNSTFDFLFKLSGIDLKYIMHAAVDCANLDILQFLSSNRQHMITERKKGKTPFHYAIERLNKKKTKDLHEVNSNIISQLLSTGVTLEEEKSEGKKTLILLAKAETQDSPERLQIVKNTMRSLFNGIRDPSKRISYLTITNARKETALMLVVARNNLELVKIFLKYGKEFDKFINAKAKDGKTALHKVDVDGAAILSELLACKNIDVYARDKQGNTPLNGTIFKRMQQNTQMLLDRYYQDGVSLTAHRNIAGNTLLHQIADQVDRDVWEYVCAKSVAMEVDSKNGREEETALKILAGKPEQEAVEIAMGLLGKGANINLVDKHQRSPLHEAAVSDNLDMLKMLLAQDKIELDLQDDKGNTALMDAAANNKYDAVRLLVEAKADIDLRNRAGKTAENIAYDMRYHQVSGILSGRRLDLFNASSPSVSREVEENKAAENAPPGPLKVLPNRPLAVNPNAMFQPPGDGNRKKVEEDNVTASPPAYSNEGN